MRRGSTSVFRRLGASTAHQLGSVLLGRLRNIRRVARWHSVVKRTTELDRFAGDSAGPRIAHLPMIGHMFLTNFEIPLAPALNARGRGWNGRYSNMTTCRSLKIAVGSSWPPRTLALGQVRIKGTGRSGPSR